MNKLTALAVVAVMTMQSCVFATTVIKGSGVRATDVRPVYDVSAIQVSQAIICEIEQSNENTVTIEADDNILPIVETKVENGLLRIHLSQNMAVNNEKIHVRVLTPDFERVHANSAASVKVVGLWTASKVKLEANSAAKIVCDQVNAEKVDADASSAATISANVSCKEATADASSAATIWYGGTTETITAESSSGARINIDSQFRTLDADASSGSNIHYKNNFGKVNAHSSSGGSVNN